MPPVRLAVWRSIRRRPSSTFADERDQQDHQHGNRQQHQDDHRAPFQQPTTPYQNACPIPIYSSNELPPGSLFSGTATSSRIGPIGGVVAGADTGAGVPVAGEWRAVGADLAHVHESRQRRSCLRIRWRNSTVPVGDGGAACRLLVRELRPQRLVAIASHRAAAAGIEALVRREAEYARRRRPARPSPRSASTLRPLSTESR